LHAYTKFKLLQIAALRLNQNPSNGLSYPLKSRNDVKGKDIKFLRSDPNRPHSKPWGCLDISANLIPASVGYV